MTHHGWKGKLEISWFMHMGFRKIKPRLQVVDTIAIREDDPTDSTYYSFWDQLEDQLLRQRAWDAEHGKKNA